MDAIYAESEFDYKEPNTIAVITIDNLPCELPKDASEDFEHMFLKHVIQHFLIMIKMTFCNAQKLPKTRNLQNGLLICRII